MGSIHQVFKNVADLTTLPVIFAGSGISKRYTSNKYDWEELLIECISQYHKNPKNKYKEYRTDVEYEITSDKVNKFSVNEQIGTKVERDFNKEYYKGTIDSIKVRDDQNPLKVFISKRLEQYQLDNEMENEINMLKKLRDKMLTVVTTNYDTFFEDHIFTEHDKIVGQDIFKKSELGTLFKIHGCSSKPNSLILTSRDYENFKIKRRVLSAKLINLFTENPVIFMGYSVSDENIRSILLEIFQCIDEDEDIKMFEKRLILIEYKKDQKSPSVGTYSMSIENVEIYLTKVTVSSFTPVLEEMQKLKRKVKFRDLKHIKDLVYDIVHDENGERKKLVNLVEDDSDTNDDEIIVAITKRGDLLDSVGITGIHPEDLFDDVLTGRLESRIKSIDKQKLLIEIQIPNLLRGNNVLPVHKYLSNFKGELSIDSKVERMRKMKEKDFLNNSIERDIDAYFSIGFDSLKDIFESDYGNSRKLNYLVIKSVYESDADEIKDFLIEYGDVIKNINGGGTYFRKMVCIYDIKKYKTPNKESVSPTNTSY